MATSMPSDGHSLQQESSEVRPPSHSGLFALLSAVTLHLGTENPVTPSGVTTTRTTTAEGDSTTPRVRLDKSTAPDENISKTKAPHTTTPTIVPESSLNEGSLPPVERSFPGVLMALLMDPTNAETLTFLPGNKFFAIRLSLFSQVLQKHFRIFSYAEFLEALTTAGFCRLDIALEDIEVFRHHLFVQGDWRKCETLLATENFPLIEGILTPSSQMSPSVTSSHDNPICSKQQGHQQVALSLNTKRKLPSNHSRQDASCSQKARNSDRSDDCVDPKRLSPPKDSHRELAHSIAINHIKAAPSSTDSQTRIDRKEASLLKKSSLEQDAVLVTTRTIVTDAIGALLKDQDHTEKLFARHEDHLSKSSLPGLTPISKQLFSRTVERSREAAVSTTVNPRKPRQPKKVSRSFSPPSISKSGS